VYTFSSVSGILLFSLMSCASLKSGFNWKHNQHKQLKTEESTQVENSNQDKVRTNQDNQSAFKSRQER